MPDLRNLREMSPAELCKVLYTWHEAFRRFGFNPDEIFIYPKILDAPTGFIGWGCTLKAQGLEFNVTVGSTWASDDEFGKSWREFVENQKTISDTTAKEWWDRYMPLPLFEELAQGLIIKGFQLSSLSN
jgi:hypothetical protein